MFFGLFESKAKRQERKRVEASARRQQAANAIAAAYQDVANRDPANIRHFEEATRGSHASIFDVALRNDLVDYARFEVANNPNLKGIVMTKVNDIVGRSPQIRFLPSDARKVDETEKKACHSLTRKMSAWMRSVKLGKKMRIACNNKIVDGESFVIAMKNGSRKEKHLQLDLRIVDCERVYSDANKVSEKNYYDGIKYDSFGDPVYYDISKDHPDGDNFNHPQMLKSGDTHRKIDAQFVYHWFRDDRAEQRRGVSELSSALPIATILRRVRKAVAINNEIAASISFLLETNYDGDEVVDSDGNTVDSSAYNGFEKVDYEVGTSMILPEGVTAKQLESKHPNSSFLEFHNAGINDIGRALGMPYNKASGRSSDYNYSSGRLDHLADDFGNSVTRQELIEDFLDPIVLHLWIAHARNTDGYLDGIEKQYLDKYILKEEHPNHIWSFDLFEDIDREKEAQGKLVECTLGANNRGNLLLQQGWDIDTHDQQAAESYGFKTIEEYRLAVARATFGDVNQGGESQEGKPNDKQKQREEAEKQKPDSSKD